MTTTTEASPAKTLKDELIEVVAAEKVEESTKLAIVDGFASFLAQSDQWEKDAYALNVTDISQKAEMDKARESRLALRRIRIDIEKKHKDVKADALARCKAIDAAKRFLVGKIEPLEAHLKEQEEFVDRYLEEQRGQRIADRSEKLHMETDMDPEHMNLGEMTDDEFSKVLQQGIDAKQARLDREKREEEERQERERKEQLRWKRADIIRPYYSFFEDDGKVQLADLSESEFSALVDDLKAKKADHDAERERIRKENERLKAEAEERERIYQLGSDRAGTLRDINTEPGDIFKLGQMSESKFQSLYSDAKEAYDEAQRMLREAEEKREAQHRATIKRQFAMQEVGGNTDYETLKAMTDSEFDVALEKATREHEAKLEEEREAAERAKQEAEAKAKAEEESRMKAGIDSAAQHAADIVLETAEAWAAKHPDVIDGAYRFVTAVSIKLAEARQAEGGSE